MKSFLNWSLLTLLVAAVLLTAINQATVAYDRRYSGGTWTFYMKDADLTCVMVKTDGERTMYCQPGKRMGVDLPTLDGDE